MEIQKIQIVVHILSGFASFMELMWVYRGVESLCRLLTAKKMPFDLPTNECKWKHYHHLQTGFICKFRREWLLWTGYVRGGSLREKLQMALKQVGMHFVLNRLIQLRVLSWTCTRYVFEAFFLPKQGQGFNPPAVHLYPNVGRVPAGIQSRSLVKYAIKLKKCSRVSVDCPQKQ